MIRNREALARTARHTHTLRAIETGIGAAHPREVLENALRLDGSRLHVGEVTYELEGSDLAVLGGGNAAGHAATALESVLENRIGDGLVVTDDPTETRWVEVVEGTHPLPAEQNVAATRRLVERAEACTERDLVLVVVAGGASALLCAPREGISLADYRESTKTLLESGATIDEINAIRKHLSTVKGGRLARALAPAQIVGVVFSDVAGNSLSTIASGPTAPDDSTYEDCLAVAERYELEFPDSVCDLLGRGVNGEVPETPGENDPAFERVSNHVVADGRTALDGAADALSAAGYDSVILSSRVEGEAREVAKVHVAIGAECLDTGEPFAPPVALLSGGETTVTVAGNGAGGPNHEFALSAALELEDDLLVAGVDTDGIDGTTPAAGALVGCETIGDTDARRARVALRDNDAYTCLNAHECCIEIGPTGTNVNDLRVVLVGEP